MCDFELLQAKNETFNWCPVIAVPGSTFPFTDARFRMMLKVTPDGDPVMTFDSIDGTIFVDIERPNDSPPNIGLGFVKELPADIPVGIYVTDVLMLRGGQSERILRGQVEIVAGVTERP